MDKLENDCGDVTGGLGRGTCILYHQSAEYPPRIGAAILSVGGDAFRLQIKERFSIDHAKLHISNLVGLCTIRFNASTNKTLLKVKV